jgi:cytochrome c oxidase subunit 2
MALLLVLLIAILIVGSIYYFAVQWLPVLAAAQPAFSDKHFQLTLLLFGAVFAITHVVLAVVVWRNRDREPGAQPGSMRAEAFWAMAAAALFFGVNAVGTRLPHAPHPAEQVHSVRIEVTGVQFRWYFRYPGPDGNFGRTAAMLVDASEGNPLGIDRSDPAAQDDFLSPTLNVPVGRPVEITLRAHDVIHSLFLPNLRLKQDAVPGMNIPLRFTADRLGSYDIACAELCGLGHYAMNAKLRVLDSGEFSAWLTDGPH